MTNDIMNGWVKNAKSSHDAVKDGVVSIIRRDKLKTKGEIILDVADKIWPSMMKMFENVRDENGLLMQPAHVRGIALNVAQHLVNSKPH
jgi:hypothetical protein